LKTFLDKQNGIKGDEINSFSDIKDLLFRENEDGTLMQPQDILNKQENILDDTDYIEEFKNFSFSNTPSEEL
jgi:hypothetical protein